MDLVSKVYDGNKAMELLQRAVEFNGIYDNEKDQFESSSTKDGSIIT